MAELFKIMSCKTYFKNYDIIANRTKLSGNVLLHLKQNQIIYSFMFFISIHFRTHNRIASDPK